jgi:hypothetical protein
MSCKAKILSTLLLSTINLFPINGAADESTPPPPSQASSPIAVTPTKIAIEDGVFERSPIRRGKRTYSSIVLNRCTIKELDPACFMEDPNLSTISFQGSTVNFSTFSHGSFGKECPALRAIELTDTLGVDLKSFVEDLADSALLDLILSGTCKLKINRAPGDTGPEISPTYSDSEVQTMIRAFREVKPTSPSVIWWLISKATLGAVASQ